MLQGHHQSLPNPHLPNPNLVVVVARHLRMCPSREGSDFRHSWIYRIEFRKDELRFCGCSASIDA